MKKIFGKSRGQMMVLVAAGLAVFIGMAGVVVDVGSLYVTRRQMQSAADAAAVAGANALHGSSSVSAGYLTAAKDAAISNGFTDGTDHVSVTAVTVSCPGAAAQQCVKANVSQPVPVYFLRALGYTTISVSTEAVAGGVNSPACIFALAPTAPKALTVNGSAGVTSACGILVDSNDSEALYGGSASNSVKASAIGVQGGYDAGPGWSPTPQSGIAPAPDPLASHIEPSTPTACDNTNYSTSSSSTPPLSAGTYCGGITISGSGGTVTFGSGMYILLGGMKITGNQAIQGTGVTFYNTQARIGGKTYNYGAINLAGGGTVTFKAPTSGAYEGMLYMQDRTIFPTGTNAKETVTGGSGSVFDGVFYFPNSQLTYSGNSNGAGSCSVSDAGYTELIANTLTFSGSQNMLICADFSSLGGLDPLKSNTFYE